MSRRLIAWSVVVLYVALVTAGQLVPVDSRSNPGNVVEDVGLAAGLGLFAVLGALLLARRPGHVMGVLFSALALLTATGVAGERLAASALQSGRDPSLAVRLLAWPNGWYWYVLIAILFVYVPLLFPDGHLPSPRWRWFAWSVGTATAAVCLLAAISERVELQTLGPDGRYLSVANPLGIDGMVLGEPADVPLFGGIAICGLAGVVVAVLVRFRRATHVERQQLKWFVLAVGVMLATILLDALPIPEADVVSSVGFAAGVVGVPVSITLAILRYRLYDIDRVISRTVTYAVVTAVLATVYVVIAIVPVAALGAPDGARTGAPDLLVAAATLVVAGVFVPVRRRVQTVVDRRFNRARYDAQRVVEHFGGRLRYDLDLDALTGDLYAVVASTVQPAQLWLWLRDEVTP